MAKEASKASAAAEPEAAPARKQPPRAAKTPERVETLRRRRLNTDRDLKNATRLTKYQNLVLEAFRELDGPATASQVLDAVAEGSSASLASSWRSSARAALAECVAAGRVKLEGDKYSAAGAKRRKAKKAAAEEGAAKKGRKRPEAAKGKKAVVASRKHAPKVVDDDDDAPARKKRKLPAKGVATASKTIPAAAAAVATKKKKGGARDEEKKKKNKRSARSESEEEKEEDEEAVVEKKERKRAKPAKPARKAPEKADAAPEGAKESTKSADGPAWEFLDRVWKRYDAEASRLVEDEYQKFVADPMQLDVRSVRSGGWAYQVDFANMKQTNIEHPAHTVRDIRRVVS